MAGFITTFVVAWGLAAFTPHMGWEARWFSMDIFGGRSLSGREFREFGGARRTRQPIDPYARNRLADGILQPVISPTNEEWPQLPPWGYGEHVSTQYRLFTDLNGEHATGWPFLAGWYEFSSSTTPAGNWSAYSIEGGVPLMDPPSVNWQAAWQLRALPLRPVWLGLTLDTAFYGALWAGLVYTFIIARRDLRARRGCCRACGYSLRGLPADSACPECGIAAAAVETEFT